MSLPPATLLSCNKAEVDGEKPEGDDRRFPSLLGTSVSNPQAVGKAGNLLIETGRLSISNGGQILSATFGKGNAGNIAIRATGAVELTGTSPTSDRPSTISTSVGEQAVGNGGDLTIEVRNLRVVGGGQISTSTLGNGNSGNLTVRASDAVVVRGASVNGETISGLLASAESGAIGQGGTLRIETGNLQVSDRGRITVRDLAGSRGAGNLQIVANSVLLDDRGLLSAETRAGLQGNISIHANSVQLRRNSLLQANAFGTATGGNIAIDTGALAALENSDITANAQQATGGRVIINAQGIFGTAFRPGLTPFSDITASSELGAEFSGVVQLNTPDVDPSRGLVTLSIQPVDASKLVAQRCLADQRGNEFIITGRGGLPPDPVEALRGNRILENFGRVRNSQDKESSDIGNQSSLMDKGLMTDDKGQILEAQSWAIALDGKVILTAVAHNATSYPLRATSPTCVTP